MRFTLSDPMFKKLLAGIAIFVALVLIVMSFWRRSKYKYPNDSETQEFPITAASTSGIGSSALITFTTGTTAHGIQAGDLVYLMGTAITSAYDFTDKVSGTGLPGLSSVSGIIQATPSAPSGTAGTDYVAVYTTTGTTGTSVVVKGALKTVGYGSGYSGTGTRTLTYSSTAGAPAATSGTSSPAVAGLTVVTNGALSGTPTLSGTVTFSSAVSANTRLTFSINGGSGATVTGTVPSAVNASVAISLGSLTNLTLGGTAVSATAPVSFTDTKVRSAGYNAMTLLKDTKLIDCQTTYLVNLLDYGIDSSGNDTCPTGSNTGKCNRYVTLRTAITAPSGGWATAGISASKSFTLSLTNPNSVPFSAGDYVMVPGIYSDASNTPSLLTVQSSPAPTTITVMGTVYGTPTVTPGVTAVQNITNAYNHRQKCIRDGATSYTRNHCKYIPQTEDGGVGAAVIPTASDDPYAYAAYQTYITDLNTIQTAYAPAMARAQAGTMANGTWSSLTPTSGTGSISQSTTKPSPWTSTEQLAFVTAARKADYAGATSKYLATVCPGFYAYVDSSNNTQDPGTKYKLWSKSSTAPNGTAAMTDATTTPPVTNTDVSPTAIKKMFYAPAVSGSTGGISDADIILWAQYAGKVSIDAGTKALSVSGGSLIPGLSFYTNKTGGSQGVSTKENWRYAYANGPGTYPKPSTWNTAT